MFELPISLELPNGEFKIRNKADYRTILDVFDAFNDLELSKEERIYAGLIIFFEDINSIYDIEKLGDLQEVMKQIEIFLNCGQENTGLQSKYRLIDWNKDAPLIASAINNVSKQEIRSVSYCHWWTFMGYYLAIGESPLSNIVSIRGKIAKGNKLEKYEQEFKRENPQYFNIDMRNLEEQEFVNDFLKKNGLK